MQSRGGLSGWLVLAVMGMGSWASPSWAVIRNAASCSASDVQSAMDSAAAGDTVQLPACPAGVGWSQQVVWTAPANVTLQGAGTSATGGGDQTVITDNVEVNGSTALLRINVSSTGVFRMTGITFQSGSATTPKDAGTVAFWGPGTVRLDHIHWKASSTVNYQAFKIGTGVFGVLDHSILDFSGTNAIYLNNGRLGSGDSGNYEWSLPTAFGGPDYFYIEDNMINGTDDSYPATRVFDGFTAAKVVVRFNSLTASCIGEEHATGHSWADERGTRSIEAYGNALTPSPTQVYPNYCLIDVGNGTALIWGNTAANNALKNVYHFNVTRKNNATYSQQDPTTTGGWGYCGTQFNGTGSFWDQNSDPVLGVACLDQLGRGQGDYLSGSLLNKINTATGTKTWPRQALEPLYIWKNNAVVTSGWGGSMYANDTDGRVVADRDYYAQAGGVQTSASSPFNGTSGTGWGTLANRPTTCTAGVGYFATDQGSWNTSTSNPYGVQQNGADGVLYQCTAANTWTSYYTPYTYPHPLQGGVQPPVLPQPPRGLRLH